MGDNKNHHWGTKITIGGQVHPRGSNFIPGARLKLTSAIFSIQSHFVITNASFNKAVMGHPNYKTQNHKNSVKKLHF
jgi:hypothetical protein